jgi:hypothetical protein
MNASRQFAPSVHGAGGNNKWYANTPFFLSCLGFRGELNESRLTV